jgi:hypothetical protein
MDFWNDIATDRSWEVLIGLKGKFDFILIGGWACYLLTKIIKSKDIDMIIDFETLGKMKVGFAMKKNPFLRKYETVIDDISIDIYVPFYSKLAIPIDYIQKNVFEIQGFKIPKPEILLILKQQAELERKDWVKGQKDRTDILNLLINSEVDIENYKKIIKQFSLKDYQKRLKEIVQTARKEFEYIGITNPREIKMKKRRILERF